MNTISAIKSRHSVRQFLDRPVGRNLVEKILNAARYAPSGANLQPWKVAVVMGQTRNKLSRAILAAAMRRKPHPEESYYPDEWFEPYKSRRFATGMALYRAVDIKREDKERRVTQWNRNYEFFEAPVGLLFYLDRRMGRGAWVDMGIFVQSVMLATTDLGLGSCAQASIADYPEVVNDILGTFDDLVLAFGLSLGYEDTEAAVNQYRVAREELDAFSRWYE
ncbi:MAG: nitroreductase [Acidiferrobacterales bacterium]